MWNRKRLSMASFRAERPPQFLETTRAPNHPCSDSVRLSFYPKLQIPNSYTSVMPHPLNCAANETRIHGTGSTGVPLRQF